MNFLLRKIQIEGIKMNNILSIALEERESGFNIMYTRSGYANDNCCAGHTIEIHDVVKLRPKKTELPNGWLQIKENEEHANIWAKIKSIEGNQYSGFITNCGWNPDFFEKEITFSEKNIFSVQKQS